VYLVRRFGIGGRPDAVARGRQSRLALVDATPIIDGRKLVIVRRDNVEHLLLIGGATDVLIEPNIVRPVSSHATAALSREAHPRAAEPEAPVRSAASELAASPSASAPQDIQLADAARWPLQPETAARAAAGEPHAPESVPSAARSPEPPRSAVQLHTTPPVPEHEKDSAATDHFAELAAALQRPSASAPESKPTPVRAGTSAAVTNDDPNLTDMAHRLEAALRRPLSPSGPTLPHSKTEPRRPGPMPGASPPAQRATPAVELPRVPPRLVAEPRLAPEPRVAPEPDLAPEPKVDAPSDEKPAFESLEREMASLLGRPPR
jgi:hypothetical protein